MKKALVSIFIFFCLLIGAALFLYFGEVEFNHPSKAKYPVRGIDISHHQGTIDWRKVNSEAFRFVYIKATEGETFKDHQFKTSWNNAKARGLDVGAYHYFTFRRSGRLQAQNFISEVPPEKGMLPPVIDLEFTGNDRRVKTREELCLELDTLESILYAYYGVPPIFYVSKEAYDFFLSGRYKRNLIWIRNVYYKPALSDGRKWMFWQYSSRGKVAGFTSPVDMNVFNGTLQEYEALKKK